MRKVLFFFLIIFSAGCTSNSLTREDIRAVAMAALQESVKQQLGGGETCLWKSTGIRVGEPRPFAYDGAGRSKLPVTVTIKGSTFGCSYQPVSGGPGNVVYSTIDNEISIQILRPLWKLQYRVVADRSKIVSATTFPCSEQSVVKGVITKVDVKGCSLTLGTNKGLFSAAIPTEKMADLFAQTYQPGLAVSVYLDGTGRQQTVYVDHQ